MENYNDPREYLQEEKGPLAVRILYRTFIYIIIFQMVFLGVPLPIISRSAPRPLRVAQEVLDIRQTEASQIKKVLSDNTTDATGATTAAFIQRIWIAFLNRIVVRVALGSVHREG